MTDWAVSEQSGQCIFEFAFDNFNIQTSGKVVIRQPRVKLESKDRKLKFYWLDVMNQGSKSWVFMH